MEKGGEKRGLLLAATLLALGAAGAEPAPAPCPSTAPAVVPARAASWTGRVRDALDGGPVVEATVTPYLDDVSSMGPTVLTDCDGRFEVPPPIRSLHVSAAGYLTSIVQIPEGSAPPDPSSASTPEAATAEPSLDIRLQPLATLDVRVADGERTVADCRVLVSPRHFGRWKPLAPADDGASHGAEVAAGFPYVLAAYRGQELLRVSDAPLVLARGERRAVELEVLPPGSVRGALRAPDGAPLAGREVALRAPVGDVAPGADAPGVDRGIPIGPPGTCTVRATDAEGGFRFENVVPGLWWVWPEDGGGLVGTPRVVLVEPGREAEVELTLASGWSLRGHVRDELGNPLAGARLTAGEATSTTDEDGHFRLAPLVGQAVTIELVVSGAGGDRIALTLELAGPRRNADIHIARDGDAWRAEVR